MDPTIESEYTLKDFVRIQQTCAELTESTTKE